MAVLHRLFLNVEKNIYSIFQKILHWINKKCHSPKQHDESTLQFQFHSLTTLEYVIIPNSSDDILWRT